MDDMINRQAAIDVMCELMHHWFGGDPKDEIREIKRELEKLPSAHPSFPQRHENDCISRQMAIDGADAIIARDTSGNNDVVKAMTAWKEYIKGLPSAQPDRNKMVVIFDYCEHALHVKR